MTFFPFVLYFYFKKPYIAVIVFFIVTMMFLTKYINPITTQYRLWKLYKQQMGIIDDDDDDENQENENQQILNN